MLDLALEDDLQTRFRNVPRCTKDEMTELVKDRRTVLGAHDAAAHVDMLCDSCYPSYTLRYWVREEGVLTLEEAMWRMSGQPAALWGLRDRGTIAPGKVGRPRGVRPRHESAKQPFERVYDFPANGDRLISRNEGIEHIWVGGTAIRTAGVDHAGVDAGQGGVVTLRPRPARRRLSPRTVHLSRREHCRRDPDHRLRHPRHRARRSLDITAVAEEVGQPRSPTCAGMPRIRKRSGTSATSGSTPPASPQAHVGTSSRPIIHAASPTPTPAAGIRICGSSHMDEYGINAQVLYPNIGVFQVNEYIGMKADPELVLDCVRAYNDFLDRLQLSRKGALHTAHDRAVLGPRRRDGRAAPRPSGGAQGHRVPRPHGGLPATGAVGPALGSVLGEGPGDGAVDQLPHRLGQHPDVRHQQLGQAPELRVDKLRCCSSSTPTPSRT